MVPTFSTVCSVYSRCLYISYMSLAKVLQLLLLTELIFYCVYTLSIVICVGCTSDTIYGLLHRTKIVLCFCV